MQRIGLIGGTSYVATGAYYKALNEVIYARTQETDFADCVIFSVNFAAMERCSAAGDREGIFQLFFEGGFALKAAGVRSLAICANTPHMYVDRLADAIGLPFIHIADATATRAVDLGYKTVALLGTRLTMEEDFIRARFEERGLAVMTPDADDRNFIHDAIHFELTRNVFSKPTLVKFQHIIEQMSEAGCDCAALACTEIPLLLDGHATVIPTLDTMRIHVDAIADVMLAGERSAAP